MKKFDESKHPRDKEGKFTNKNTSSSSVATKEKESNEYTEKVKKYKEKIQFQKESTDFGRNIDKFLNGKIKDSLEIKVCSTPSILQKYGAPDYPIIITKTVINKILFEHEIDVVTLKKVPFHLLDPKYILKGNDKEGGNSSIVCVINIKDKRENFLNVIIYMNKTKNYFNVNRIASIYGRRNFENYIKIQELKGNILYKKR